MTENTCDGLSRSVFINENLFIASKKLKHTNALKSYNEITWRSPSYGEVA